MDSWAAGMDSWLGVWTALPEDQSSICFITICNSSSGGSDTSASTSSSPRVCTANPYIHRTGWSGGVKFLSQPSPSISNMSPLIPTASHIIDTWAVLLIAYKQNEEPMIGLLAVTKCLPGVQGSTHFFCDNKTHVQVGISCIHGHSLLESQSKFLRMYLCLS